MFIIMTLWLLTSSQKTYRLEVLSSICAAADEIYWEFRVTQQRHSLVTTTKVIGLLFKYFVWFGMID